MSPAEFQRCNECRALNEPRALFCSRCGASLYGPVHGGKRRRSSRITPAGIAMGIAILLVLAVAVIVLVVIVQHSLTSPEKVQNLSGETGTAATLVDATTTSTAESTDTSISSTVTSSGSTGATAEQSTTLVRPSSVAASSTLKATSTNSYGATNLLDGDVATAWNEGADGPGIGEWVKFTFSTKTVLLRIEIANGYQKDPQRFKGNPRVKTLKIEYSDGSTKLVDLRDTTEFQAITPTKQPVDWVKLVIVSVYPGDSWEDTALSDVRFYAASE